MPPPSLENLCILTWAHLQATGNIGGYFARALLQTGKHTVTALTREGSKSTPPEGAKVVKVNYDDDDSLVSALRGQQFLIITLGVTAAPDLHARIAAAAGKAGVQYIMPNAFGNPLNLDAAPQPGTFEHTVLVRRNEADNGVSSPVVLPCGFWYEWSLALGNEWFGFEIKDRKVTFFDDGRRVMTVSTWDQCGRAVAALLSLPEAGATPSLADFKGGEARIYSFRVSQRDMLDSLHRVLGTSDADWTISYESTAQRIADGVEGMKSGFAPWAFAKILYGRAFQASNKQADFAAGGDTANEALGLPQESLDEATARAVAMVESGWNPFA